MRVAVAVLLAAQAWESACASSSMAASRARYAEGAAVSPIQKVVMMLSDMMAKAKAEKGDEQVRFAAYKQFCLSTSSEKRRSITKGQDMVEQLQADVTKADAEVQVLAKHIAALDDDITTWEKEKKETEYQRKVAHEDFQKTHQDYTDSVDAVGRAVETVKQSSGTITQGEDASLVQASLLDLSDRPGLPEGFRGQLLSLLQTRQRSATRARDEADPEAAMDAESALMQDAMFEDAPEANVFESSSGGIMEMITRLGAKFKEEKHEVERNEANERHNYEMMLQDLTDSIESATSERGQKAAEKADMEKEKAGAEGECADTQNSLEQDQKFLADLEAECSQKSTDYEKRQELRAGEIQAINQAIELMSSDKVAGASSLNQLRAGVSYAQLRTSSGSMSTLKLQSKVAAFLRQRGRLAGSSVLSLLADRASSDPFKKVSQMIRDMIVKLMEEANEEAEHKGFCDTELGQNKMTRDAKSEEAEGLKASIQELSADVSKLTQEIAELSADITEINSAVAKATEARTGEKAKNEQTVTDAKIAQEAVAQALAVLKDFYTKAADATALQQVRNGPIEYDARAIAILKGAVSPSLVQEGVPGAPETFDSAYTGMASGGVVGMLEVIESDFARLESETASAEAEAQRAFDDFSNDSATDKAVKETDMKDKEGTKQAKESALATAKKDLRATNEELDAALTYFDKLKPSCVDAGQSYEERVARRKEEIESLQEALKILSGEDIS